MEITEEMIIESVKRMNFNDRDMYTSLAQSNALPAARPVKKTGKMKHYYDVIDNEFKFGFVIE